MSFASTGFAAYLASRRSVPSRYLGEPGPDAVTLDAILTMAARVPDHGKLEPWRFVVIIGEARLRLGTEAAALRARIEPDTLPEQVEKDREQFASAPVVVAVVSKPAPHAKIPEWEQVLSAGAVCLNMLHAAEAHGFGAQWLSGWPCYNPEARALFHLSGDEQIAGFIHIGTPAQRMPDRGRPDVAALTTHIES
ncbi:MAG: nitroreductase [Pseudomonadota bacterium]